MRIKPPACPTNPGEPTNEPDAASAHRIRGLWTSVSELLEEVVLRGEFSEAEGAGLRDMAERQNAALASLFQAC